MQRGNTREKLIMAALDLFSVKGYEGTSVDEIAAYIGIKGPTIYKYFKGKEELLNALIEKADEVYSNGMENNTRGAETINSGKELKEFALLSIRFTIANEIAVKMRRLLSIEQYRSEMFAERATLFHVTHMRSVFAGIFRELMDRGVMIRCDPDIAALQFTAPATLLIQMCDRQPGKKDEALDTIERHFDAFIERYCVI